MRRRSILGGLLVLGTLLAGPAPAATTPHADAFLLLPVSAREIGLGQAVTATVDDATAFHWNPGGLGMVDGIDVAASYTRLFRGLGSHQVVAVGTPVGGGFVVGAGWVRLGIDDIPYLPDISNLVVDDREQAKRDGPTGYFSWGENAYLFSFARRNEFLFDMGWQYLTLPVSAPVGVTVKYLTAGAGDSISGSGLGVDFGAQLRLPLGRAIDNESLGDLMVGASIANIGGTRMTWDTASERTDTQAMAIRAGVAYAQPLAFLRSTLTGALTTAPGGQSWGIEYTFLDRLSLRAGKDASSEHSIALGAGLTWRGLGIDYAIQRHTLGATHRVSLRWAR